MSGDNYPTDFWIMNLFETWFDPCPLNPNPIFDGLDLPWGQYHDRIFVNPPYSNPLPWVEKAIREVKENNCIVVMLLKHDTSTKWYSKLHEAGARFLLVNGRLKHQTNRAAPFPSVLAVLSWCDYDIDQDSDRRTLDEY